MRNASSSTIPLTTALTPGEPAAPVRASTRQLNLPRPDVCAVTMSMSPSWWRLPARRGACTSLANSIISGASGIVIGPRLAFVSALIVPWSVSTRSSTLKVASSAR